MRRRALPGILAGTLAALLLLFILTDLPGRPNGPGGQGMDVPVQDVPVMVVDHGYHAGIILPRALLYERADALGLPRLREVARQFVAYEWLELGWGDEGFYRHVPEVAALSLPLALKALFGADNPSVLHVVGFSGPPKDYFSLSDLVRIPADRDGLDGIARAIEAVLASARGEGVQPLGAGLYGTSLFFRAVGAYHLTSNCNHWVARLVNAAGAPVSLAAATASFGLLADLRLRGGASAP